MDTMIVDVWYKRLMWWWRASCERAPFECSKGLKTEECVHWSVWQLMRAKVLPATLRNPLADTQKYRRDQPVSRNYTPCPVPSPADYIFLDMDFKWKCLSDDKDFDEEHASFFEVERLDACRAIWQRISTSTRPHTNIEFSQEWSRS